MTTRDQEYLSYDRKMVTIRQFETLAGELFAASKIPGFIHPSIGQEASAVGVCSCLREDDYLTTTHRGHGHMITKGADLKKNGGRTVPACERQPSILNPWKPGLFTHPGLSVDPSVSPVQLLKDFGGCSEPTATRSCPHPRESIYIVRETKSRRNHGEHCIFGYKHR